MLDQPKTLAELVELGKWLRAPADGDEDRYAQEAKRLLRIRDRNGNEVPLAANEAQQRFDRIAAGGTRQHIILKARQMGITTWIAGRFFLKTITAPGVMTVQVAQTREAAEGIFRMVQRFFDCLPEELKKELKRSRSNVGQMSFAALDSEFRILSAADPNAGRGLTIHNLHCSELSRWTGDATSTLAGLRAALVPTGELVMESTPNGAAGCFYDEWRNADERGVARHFFPWWIEPAYVAAPVTELRPDELRLMQEGLSAEQIGFRRGLERSYRGLRTQEFAEDSETCFRVSGDCCFETKAVFARMDEAPKAHATRRNGALEIWLGPQKGREYVVAVDTAGGGERGDFTAMQVVDLETGMQCAELRERLAPLAQAEAAAELAREYNGALIVVERNNHGGSVIAYLQSVERYARLYRQGSEIGWLTLNGSKMKAISGLGAKLVDTPELFMSRRFLDECRTFLRLTGGTAGAASGSHDDLVMAMAIAHAVRDEVTGRVFCEEQRS